jgi:signal transduction histidine kinase
MFRLGSRTRGALLPPGAGETVRAFAIFAGLLALLGWAAHALAFQEMTRIARQIAIARGDQEASAAAAAVIELGRGPMGLNFSKVREGRSVLERTFLERLEERPELRFIEVRVRFGARVALAQSPGGGGGAVLVSSKWLVVGGVPQGEVRVGISGESIDADIASIRQSLRWKIGLAALLGAALLVLGLAYVLHLTSKNRELENARLHAERNAYRGLLASGLAHEIRNPLNAMNMNLQMLEEELQGAPEFAGGDLLDLLASTKSEIKRLERLVTNFLLYARPSPPKFESKDINELLRNTAVFLQADFRQSGVALELDLEPLLPSVDLDESQFRQAIMNVLVNARQVMREGGAVALSSKAGPGGDIVVEIRDQGPGIPPENRDHIFEPFFSKRAGGTGLGLAIARLMVEAHGGRIQVESEVGKGTTFRIRLPRRHDKAGA